MKFELKYLKSIRNEDFLNNNIYEVGVVAIDDGDEFKVIHPSNYEGDFDLSDVYRH